MTTTPTTAQTLAAEGIADYAQDLRQLSWPAELRGALCLCEFRQDQHHVRDQKSDLAGVHGDPRHGRRPPIAGNLRSFWYNHFACEAGRRLGLEALRAAVAAVCNAPRAPAGVNPDLIEDAPDTPGAYLLYDAQGAALFAGRAANLRTQLLAHFSARGRHAQEQRQALQAGAVEWFSTAGELGAALHQLRALETLEPRHNRPHRQRRASMGAASGAPRRPSSRWACAISMRAQRPQLGTRCTVRFAHAQTPSLRCAAWRESIDCALPCSAWRVSRPAARTQPAPASARASAGRRAQRTTCA